MFYTMCSTTLQSQAWKQYRKSQQGATSVKTLASRKKTTLRRRWLKNMVDCDLYWIYNKIHLQRKSSPSCLRKRNKVIISWDEYTPTESDMICKSAKTHTVFSDYRKQHPTTDDECSQ